MQPYEQLEVYFGRYIERRHTVACSSGTAALHLALESLPLGKRRRVIVPDFTMVACARAVIAAGLQPLFVDCNEQMLLDIDKLPQDPVDVAAVMPVHIYGRRCNMDAIAEYAEKHNLYVIEDMAELHGVSPHSKTSAACWSFYKNKVIFGEEGGMVAFREEDFATNARSLRSLGFTDLHDFYHNPRGMNYRLANVLAELVLRSLDCVGNNVAYRRLNEQQYDSLIPKVWQLPPRMSPWVYDLRIPGMDYVQQSCIVHTLQRQGIEARHAFKPMHIQPEFKTMQHESEFPMADRLSQEVIYLPLVGSVSPAMAVDRLLETVASVGLVL